MRFLALMAAMLPLLASSRGCGSLQAATVPWQMPVKERGKPKKISVCTPILHAKRRVCHCNSDDTEPQLYRYKEECEDACINPPPANLGSPKVDIDQTYITIGPVGNDVRPDEAAVTQITTETTQVQRVSRACCMCTGLSFPISPCMLIFFLLHVFFTTEVTATSTQTPAVTTDATTSTTEEQKVLDSSAKIAKELVKTSAEVINSKEADNASKSTSTQSSASAPKDRYSIFFSMPKTKECVGGAARGPCSAALTRWYYDEQEAKCKRFTFSGCGGNGNNYDTEEACSHRCAPPPMGLPKCEKGDALKRNYAQVNCAKSDCPYGYKCSIVQQTSVCCPENNKIIGLQTSGSADVCSLPKERGPCDKYELRFYFNAELKECKYFFWGGCQGNKNNFEKVEDCESTCGIAKVRDSIPTTPASTTPGQRLPFRTTQGIRITPGNFSRNEDNSAPESPTTAASPLPIATASGRVLPSEATSAFESSVTPEVQRMRTTGSATVHVAPTRAPPIPQMAHCWKECKYFFWGGCQGNKNNFEKVEDCESTCGIAKVRDSIPTTPASTTPGQRLPFRTTQGIRITPGNFSRNEDNSAPESMFYFKICDVFTYTGCQGNGNNYASREECMAICHKESAPVVVSDFANVCKHDVDAGECNGVFQRFAFDTESGECRPFTYGGCGGNGNNFATLAECRIKCQKVALSPGNLCEHDIEVGECSGVFVRFGYDKSTNDCRQFTYGGCGGNGNNFATIQECRNVCIKKVCNANPQCDLTRCQIVNDRNGCPFCSCPPTNQPLPPGAGQCPEVDADKCKEPCIVINNRKGCKDCVCPSLPGSINQPPASFDEQDVSPPAPSTPRPTNPTARVNASFSTSPASTSSCGALLGPTSSRSPPGTQSLAHSYVKEPGPCKHFVDRWFFNVEDGTATHSSTVAVQATVTTSSPRTNARFTAPVSYPRADTVPPTRAQPTTAAPQVTEHDHLINAVLRENQPSVQLPAPEILDRSQQPRQQSVATHPHVYRTNSIGNYNPQQNNNLAGLSPPVDPTYFTYNSQHLGGSGNRQFAVNGMPFNRQLPLTRTSWNQSPFRGQEARAMAPQTFSAVRPDQQFQPIMQTNQFNQPQAHVPQLTIRNPSADAVNGAGLQQPSGPTNFPGRRIPHPEMDIPRQSSAQNRQMEAFPPDTTPFTPQSHVATQSDTNPGGKTSEHALFEPSRGNAPEFKTGPSAHSQGANRSPLLAQPTISSFADEQSRPSSSMQSSKFSGVPQGFSQHYRNTPPFMLMVQNESRGGQPMEPVHTSPSAHSPEQPTNSQVEQPGKGNREHGTASERSSLGL
ncbi:Kunitz/Bovine pancreatic trypsin inhibitor domain protein [Ostertagia ostertagi]